MAREMIVFCMTGLQKNSGFCRDMYACISQKSNKVSALAVSKDRRWFASIDEGKDSMIIVWESVPGRPESANVPSETEGLLSAYPIKTIYDPHRGGSGAICAEFTSDSKYLVTLGNGTRMYHSSQNHNK